MDYRYFFLAILLLTGCEKETPPEHIRPVKAIQVKEAGQTANQASFPGTLRALSRADLSFRVDGTVAQRDISVGQKVAKNDLLMQLDPRDYQIALQRAAAKVETVQSQLNFASRDYVRMQNIYNKDPGAISQSMLDSKKENANQLKAELVMAQADMEKAKDDLSYTELSAPFDGIISAIYVEQHEQVHAKQPVVRILDSFDREMEINVPEKYMGILLKRGKDIQLRVYLDNLPDKVFKASIKEIGTEASSTTQTYPVTLTIKEPPEDVHLLAGMSGRAVLEMNNAAAGEEKKYIPVPIGAILVDPENQSYVWVYDRKTERAHKRSVTLAKNAKGETVFVEKGLQPNDWVIIAGGSYLSEGQKVKLLTEQSGP